LDYHLRETSKGPSLNVPNPTPRKERKSYIDSSSIFDCSCILMLMDGKKKTTSQTHIYLYIYISIYYILYVYTFVLILIWSLMARPTGCNWALAPWLLSSTSSLGLKPSTIPQETMLDFPALLIGLV
jgi:hypothetical protein